MAMTTQTPNTVQGKITDNNNNGLVNLKVEIYDVDMRSWQLLAGTTTDKEGRYELTWTHDQLRGRGKGQADIAVKVYTEKKAELFKTSMKEVRFNASERERIDIKIRQELPREVIEFDFLVKEVTFLANKIAIADLQESKEHQDVTFLSKELRVDKEKIEFLVIAHQLENCSEIKAAYFYALLNQRTLLKGSFSKPFTTRLSINIHSDTDILLYDFSLLEANIIQEDLDTAAKEKIIGENISYDGKYAIEKLHEFRKQAAQYYAKEYPEQVVKTFSEFIEGDKLKEVESLFKENIHDLGSFIEKVSDPSFYKNESKSTEAQTHLNLGKLFGIGNEIIPQLIKTKKISKAQDIKKLAKLNKGEWLGELNKSKEHASGDSKTVDLYASFIVRKMEKDYPTTAFTAQLEREKAPILDHQKEIISFLNKHEDFDLVKDNIDLFIKEKKVSEKESEKIRKELKSVQRIFKIVPNYSKTKALREQKIHSAQSIVAAGEDHFVKHIATKAGIQQKEAEEIFEKASRIHSAAVLVMSELQDTLRSRGIAVFNTSGMEEAYEAVGADFPNLKSLFNLQDSCACEHCRSVYSPAAYLVEILEFIKNRSVLNLKTNPRTKSLGKDVLFKRRPDLGEIDLGCENANTPVKYIDLVCELLEEDIAPSGIHYKGVLTEDKNALKGKISQTLYSHLLAPDFPITPNATIYPMDKKDPETFYLRDEKLVCRIEKTGDNTYDIQRLRQTFSTAEELAAAPEYVNDKAYDLLKDSEYAFGLPFDLAHTEAKAYFDRFGIAPSELMEQFQTEDFLSSESIAAEALGLTERERELVVTSKTIAEQRKIWNIPEEEDVLKYMEQVDHFLDKTSLSYSELEMLLALKFINPKNTLQISHGIDMSQDKMTISCDTSEKKLSKLTEDTLDRIHRFLRLQKKTTWNFEVLDQLISQRKLGNGTLDNACIIKAANLLQLSSTLGIKIEELIGFFGHIPYKNSQQDKNKKLYDQVFLNKAKNGYIDDRLTAENVLDNEAKIAKPSIRPGGWESIKIAEVDSYISTVLQISLDDLTVLKRLLPTEDLTFSNLSYLYGISSLLKKLQLKSDDLVAFLQLTDSAILTSPEDTLAFVKIVNEFKHSPIRATEALFILQHPAKEAEHMEINTGFIKVILEELQHEYQAAFLTHISKFDELLSADEHKETLQQELSKVGNIDQRDIDDIIKTIFKDKIRSLEEAILIFNRTIGDFVEQVKIEGILKDLYSISKVDEIAENQNKLIKEILKGIASFNFQTNQLEILERLISKHFKVDSDLAKVVLKYSQLKQYMPGEYVSAILQSDELIDTRFSDVAELESINETNFKNQYASLRLLHKVSNLLRAFELDLDETEWFFQNNELLGWFEFDNIPFESGQKSVSFSQYLDFVQLLNLKNALRPVSNPADASNPISFNGLISMLLSNNSATREEFIIGFSILSGHDEKNIKALDEHLFSTLGLDHYKAIETWRRVLKAAESLRILGMSLSHFKGAKSFLPDVNSLRAALKARYDEEAWLDTLKEIMDGIRTKKRDALIAYQLATKPEMKDSNDLYDHFLIDVKMESCMPSSRIVQAQHTVQLFVQRCLMGLEQEAVADLEQDKDWEQWKWMKNYRIWEANRKIFLYPENWIEAELRDDKSFLFTELENEIQQNELTNTTAEKALVNYLEKLDEIAFLEVMASWYETNIKVMHVFARTKGGDPSSYYYRKLEQERSWTPWEKVELDITGDHLIAFVRNNRLCLAWPVFTEEADPSPAAIIPDSTAGKEVPLEKPKRTLKIQLAISELANGQWQPKKVSKDGLLTTSSPSNLDSDFKRDTYQFVYVPIPAIENLALGDLIVVFSATADEKQRADGDKQRLNGAFTLEGCKGHPEVFSLPQEVTSALQEPHTISFPFTIPDFLPDFDKTELISQRYVSEKSFFGGKLSVKNGFSVLHDPNFQIILSKTIENFRISYPHQFTKLDGLSLLIQLFSALMEKLSSSESRKTTTPLNINKIPTGTLLPYFKENNNRAYLVLPGLYKSESTKGLQDSEKRTASDVLVLIDNIIDLYKRHTNPVDGQDYIPSNVVIENLIRDEEFQDILKELTLYNRVVDFYNLLIGSSDTSLENVDYTLAYGEQFKNLYHPLVCSLRSTLYKSGIPELMKRKTQMQRTPFDFRTHFNPNINLVPQMQIRNEEGFDEFSYPIEDVDFSSDGSYSNYNWELFFHVPFLLANRLTKNQRFEEAQEWFHYIFNPTGALEGDSPQKFWVTKPFFLKQREDYIKQRIDTLLYKTLGSSSEASDDLEFAINQWRQKPFKPDVVARFRPVVYQKALLMKYIDNLTEWGDHLFRQDSMESIAQATQMYILADKLLGPKPKVISSAIQAPYQTYNQLEDDLDTFGNALIDLENIIPEQSGSSFKKKESKMRGNPAPITLSMHYFCIPANEKMSEYWDRIADRLFKIRNCQNIDGVERSLALFAPPIDPGMLARASASGLDISAVIAGLNAPLPYYRFSTLSQKATELAQELRGLGNSLLQVLEKKDAEALTLLRNELELKVLDAVTDLKQLQIGESIEQIEVLNRTRKVVEERQSYYAAIEKINAKEQLNLDKLGLAHGFQISSQISQALAGAFALVPSSVIGVSGFGGTPNATVEWGGFNFSNAARSASDVLSIFSSIASYEANRASILGGYDRREADWQLQERMATKELASIEKQIKAAEIRKEIAEKDLKNHELQIENAQKTDEYMRSKFTNKELYDWMLGQISSVYFKSYQLAHDFAKKAERCYRFELGNDDTFISYGYWDSMKKGLQSADHLIHDIKRMETSYIDKNKREYEITKHVSLALLDPLALLKLRNTGICDFDIPEVMYDIDHAGHYFRRLKSVSISIPCISGPYTSISAKLSLINNRYRKNTALSSQYIEDSGNDDRFVYNIGAIQSIATSNAQNDSGVFELNFRDERYLPFEGTGAISSWRLELPDTIKQFDYNTISDAIIHIKYTSREGGSGLRTAANQVLAKQLGNIKQSLNKTGLQLAINVKHDLPNEWHLLKQKATTSLKIDKSRLPYMVQSLDTSIEKVFFAIKLKKAIAAPLFAIQINHTENELIHNADLDQSKEGKKIFGKTIEGLVELDTPFTFTINEEEKENLEELIMVINYKIPNS